MVEQANSTLVGILKKLAADKPSSWDYYLTCAVMAYKITSYTADKINYPKDVFELIRCIAALQDKAFNSLINFCVLSFLRDQDALLSLPQLEVGGQNLMYI
ncbi:hypothetical protein DSO57_1024378 [Entomophthora muscae]|uniref:Uncharacterized protein n=1 Tax=Entomophthora muscae TaxID=34485 RepID=A0ACC2RTN0_9FUNG|nr:hypothetical protein DSO57_1024378 [Entomophthora muscae]